jgi:hypothetical protein
MSKTSPVKGIHPYAEIFDMLPKSSFWTSRKTSGRTVRSCLSCCSKTACLSMAAIARGLVR